MTLKVKKSRAKLEGKSREHSISTALIEELEGQVVRLEEVNKDLSPSVVNAHAT